jgi:hypothetical protein
MGQADRLPRFLISKRHNDNMKKLMLLFGLLMAAVNALADTPALIAGLVPDQRPDGAPVITVFEQTPAWRAQALRGIAPPPTGLEFLGYQGAWYTPFIYPNLTGPYDIRGLHSGLVRKD